MSNLNERMVDLQGKQKSILEQLESIIKEYESTDIILEHEELKKEFTLIQAQYQELKKYNEKINQENAQLRTALHEQMLDEKLNILRISKKKLETYFNKESGDYQNRLEQWEHKTKEQINKLKNKAQKELAEEKQDLITRIEQFSLELNEKIQKRKEQLATEERELLEQVDFDMNEFRSEPVDDEVMQKRIRQNQMEMKIGLNWVNKIGIILILFGVGAASKYTYSTWFNEYMKGISFFLLGGALLVGGEWAYRRSKQIFATGLLGGGISVLYGAIFYSYFLLDILGLSEALLLSVGVTLLSIVLSLHYHSKTIISLGLIGGYLPIFSYVFAFGLSGNGYYVAMGYLFLLNLSVLLISLWKKWNVTNYISFLLHIPSLIYLVMKAPSGVIGMAYTILAFFMYLSITLYYSFKKKEVLRDLDVVLLGLNTFFSVVITYLLFDRLGWNDYRGLLALVFAVVYIGLGKWVEREIGQEKETIILFYATSLTFAILMIPFQFGVQWLGLGWLLEGMILLLYGQRIKHRGLELSGWGIFLASLLVFYVIDFLQTMIIPIVEVRFFDFKFAAATIAMLFVTFIYSHQRIPMSIRLFKYWSLINVWIYFLYSGTKLYNHLIPVQYTQFDFYKLIIIGCITFGTGYLIGKVQLLHDKVVLYYRLLLYLIGNLTFLTIVVFHPVLKSVYANNAIHEYIALAVLIFFNIFVFFSLRDLVLIYIRRFYKNIDIYPVVVGVYLLGIITGFMIVQFRLEITNLLFSLVYLTIAVGFILYGFKRRFVYIRRLGLALSLLSTTKLFVFDLSFLEQGSKIFAYFIFGILLLGISFIYQKVSNNMGGQKQNETV